MLALLVLASVAPPADAAAPVVIPEWRVVGPFEAGSREGLVHHLAEASGRIPDDFTFEETYPSALAPGGRVAWRTASADRDESGAPTRRTTLRFEEIAWDAQQDALGVAGLLNIAYLAASFELDAPALLLIEAARCSGRLDGTPFAGDPYGAGMARSVVRGRAGRNTLLVASTGYGAERAIELALTPVPAGGDPVVIIPRDVLVPDLVEGVEGRGFAGVPVVNVTDAWLADVGVALEGALDGRARLQLPLAPRSMIKVPVGVAWPRTPPGSAEVRIAVTARGAPTTVTVPLRVRAPGDARVETFLSRLDGSAQAYGLLPATSPDATGLLLSLHGAGVGCAGQAAAYRPLADFTVVAPLGRRPFGFDWHEWGELDALEVLELARARLGADPDRVVLTGQSMGGHGAWALGAHRPDLFAALTPSAAWIGYDSVVPFTLRRSTHEAPPELQSVLLRALAPGRVSGLLDNLEALPVHAFHGGADDNIPPWHERWLVGALQHRGFDARLCELPGEGHWSDLDFQDQAPEGCADTTALRAWWSAARRDPRPPRVVLVTSDPDVGGTRAWLRLLAQDRVAVQSRIEALVEDAPLVRVATSNVASLALDLDAVGHAAGAVVVDGQRLAFRRSRDRPMLVLQKSRSRWTARLDRKPEAASLRPRPGGAWKALTSPFLVVAGTLSREDGALDAARAVSEAWLVRAGGLAPIVRDVDLTDDLRRRHGLVLVGGPDVNAESARLRRSLNVVLDGRGGATLGGRRLAGREGLASLHWQPSPQFPERSLLVLQAQDAQGDDLLPALHPIAPGAGFPDFAIVSPLVRQRGWGGFVAAGFWDASFGVDRDEVAGWPHRPARNSAGK